ncbi:30S ribosomal protein S5 [Candidatus Proelusimicrobium excrementi]|uniref:30S ribosomal protein S5 n=1 Tax=Candidatus Proelusimicrobium excrementi TaxID=3416222 RepID=UPI003D129BB3|nr:30S ribosomal protein S5 [Elusimicrobiota bacterium]
MLNKETPKSENKKEAKGQRTEFQMRPKAEGVTTVIQVARTAKVVKGGKRFGFRALVVVGDGNGKVGVSIGKANQVQFAVSKAEFHARRHTVKFPIVNDTIPHEVIGKFGSASVWMKPAAPGTGVIAGAGVRLVLEAAGIKNILAKSLGSTNACNLAYATMKALEQLKSKEAVLAQRGKSVEAAAPAVAEAPAAEKTEAAA